jgi:hypothetical protein
MGRPQFSIASLFVVIGILSIALAAFRQPSYMWANVTFTVAFAVNVLAIINIIYGKGASRAYWVGFLLCGGTYFTICTVPGIRDTLCPRLATEVVLDLIYPHVSPPPPQPGNARMVGQGQVVWQVGIGAPPPAPTNRWAAWSEPDRRIGLGYPIGTVNLVSSEAFRQIGHSLAALLVAVLGGMYARRRYNKTIMDVPPDVDR